MEICPQCSFGSALGLGTAEGGAASAVEGYEIMHELGRGAMGVVWLARERNLDRLVALKLIASADPRLSAALQAMHENAARPWTVPELAAVSGLSRAAFARAFHQALGQALADARDLGKGGMVLAADGSDGALRIEAAEDGYSEFGSDARDGDEALEETLFFAFEKAEESNLILADLRVNVQRGLCADGRQRSECRHRNGDVVADAGGLDNGLAGLF